MECYTPTDYILNCYEDDEIEIPSLTASQELDQRHFFINITCEFIIYGITPDGDMSMYPRPPIQETHTCFVPVDKVLMEDTSCRNSVTTSLYSLGVPRDTYEGIWEGIKVCADSIAQKPDASGRKILPMTVHVSITSEEELGEEGAGTEEIDAVLRESMMMEDARRRQKPARRDCVEALEKVDDVSLEIACVICQDGIEVSSDALRMPCGHVYHGDCLVKWLEITNFCPLCRFQLPSSDDDDDDDDDDDGSLDYYDPDNNEYDDDFSDEDSEDDEMEF